MSQTPLLGAIAVVIHDGNVLLAKRKKQPDAGMWGFPGGHVEWGETALAAAARELHEETGVLADPVDYLTNYDLLRTDENEQVTTHYLLVGVACTYLSGTPIAADDVSDAQWFSIEEVRANTLPMSARVIELMELALTRV
jgi:8-oxo-dGTP diphosphatase